jgi:hypothetical protein
VLWGNCVVMDEESLLVDGGGSHCDGEMARFLGLICLGKKIPAGTGERRSLK